MYKFEIPKNKTQELENWMDQIHEKYNVADAEIQFIFTPTGIGDIVEVYSNVSKTKINLTDYENLG